MTFIEIYYLNSLLITWIWSFASAGSKQLWKDVGCSSSGGRKPVNPTEVSAPWNTQCPFPLSLGAFFLDYEIFPAQRAEKEAAANLASWFSCQCWCWHADSVKKQACVRFSTEAWKWGLTLSHSSPIWSESPRAWNDSDNSSDYCLVPH